MPETVPKTLGVAVVVLAAGCSSRMGHCKAWCEQQGEPLISRAVRLAHSLGLDPIVIVGHSSAVHRSSPCYPLRLEPLRQLLGDLRFVHGGESPIDSLRAGMAQLPAGRSFLHWPVDTLGVDVELLRALLALHEPRKVVRPVHRGRGGHPALFGGQVAALLWQAAADRGARAVLRATPGLLVDLEVSSAAVTAGLNTPEQARQWGIVVPSAQGGGAAAGALSLI